MEISGTPRLDLCWLRSLPNIKITPGIAGPSSVHVEWCPGDMTRYEVTIAPIFRVGQMHGCPGPFAWVISRWRPSPPATMMVPLDIGYLSAAYIVDKLGRAGPYTADLIALIANAALPQIHMTASRDKLRQLHELRPDVEGFRAPEPLAT